jgi:hypothetical protein
VALWPSQPPLKGGEAGHDDGHDRGPPYRLPSGVLAEQRTHRVRIELRDGDQQNRAEHKVGPTRRDAGFLCGPAWF